MNVDKDVILWVRATGCSPCQMFSKFWDNFVNKMKEMKLDTKFVTQIITAKSPKLPEYDKTAFPQDMNEYLKIFPSVFFFTRDEWNNSLKTKAKPNGYLLRRDLIQQLKIDELMQDINKIRESKQEPKPKVSLPQAPVPVNQTHDVCSNSLNIIGYRCK